MKTTINYGIHKNYLSHWNISHALREIIQNFLDYGEYETRTFQFELDENKIVVEISNDYNPTDLNFLAIGLSIKQNVGSRGKYGEGLKMALLIFAREGKYIEVQANGKFILPTFQNTEIGDTLCLKICDMEHNDKFTIRFEIEKDIWEAFIANIITEKDIIYDDKYYGRIVDKEIGNIYCGGLFVKKVDNLTKAYDINPSFMSLDRDRMMPSSFDVSYASSKINSSYGKLSIKDLNYSDTQYIEKIPIEIKRQIKPVAVGNTIAFTYKDKGKTVIINNDNAKHILTKDSFFSKILKRLRNYLAKQLGVYELLVEFQKKHIHNEEAKQEFEIILERLK